MIRKQEGITLIALVVTIILLLIIAGITIGAFTGQDGILNQTKDSVSSVEQESAITKVSAEVYESYAIDGTIDFDKLNNKLAKVERLKYNGNAITSTNKITELPVEIEVNGYILYIDEEGNVGDINTNPIRNP